MRLPNNSDSGICAEHFYFMHGRGVRTKALFGYQRGLRALSLAGLSEVDYFDQHFVCFDDRGAVIREFRKRVPADQEGGFDSAEVFGTDDTDELVEGSVRMRISAVAFKDDAMADVPIPPVDLNGVLLIYGPGRFITGVHMYHGVKPLRVAKTLRYYVSNVVRRLAHAVKVVVGEPSKILSRTPWPFDAIGASVVHSGPGSGEGVVIMHCDEVFPGKLGFLEVRGTAQKVERLSLPSAKRNSLLRVAVPDRGADGTGDGWSHVLCAHPPPFVSRYLTGERFHDGSICLDHTYFQQPKGSRDVKVNEVRFFDRCLLSDAVIGPSNPWPCVHSEKVETMVALPNIFHPDEPHVYDLWVFDSEGKLVLDQPAFVRLKPYGHEVFNVSAELRRHGIDQLDGMYLVTHSAANSQDRLPNRLHVQGIYRFGGKYWNGVQGDASIWASPTPPVPEIERLSLAKVRRKQYWFGPVIESRQLESVLAVANLSYSLHYGDTQTLGVRYYEGNRPLAEAEITVTPFASTMIPISQMFGDHMSARGAEGSASGTVLIYPKTGVTYCASILYREKETEIFVIEHVLPLKRLPAEEATA